MAGPVATKSEKEKSTGKAKGRMPESARCSASLSPYAEIMDLQNTAGNQAVSQLLQSDKNGAPLYVEDIPTSGGSQPLEPIVRGEMEDYLGENFSQVRIHTDAKAVERAQNIKARAYTLNREIFFGTGQYRPQTLRGKCLLVHELAHVIQQSRAGNAERGSDMPQIESQAKNASFAFAQGAGSFTVSGRVSSSVICKEDDENEDELERFIQRRQEKERTLQRKMERKHAGVSEDQVISEQAEQDLKKLERKAQSPGAKSLSQKNKEKILDRFEGALKGSDHSQLAKNKRKGNLDEALRTPSAGRTAGNPQTKSVAGHEELPFMELKEGEVPFAQPDYSIYRRKADGSIERLHVNLKANQLHKMSVSQARAAAKYNTEQAIRNSRHLPEGESIILSYIRMPSKEVQDAMNAEHFREGSPIKEVHFGSLTVTRSEYMGSVKPQNKSAPESESTQSKNKDSKTKITSPGSSKPKTVSPKGAASTIAKQQVKSEKIPTKPIADAKPTVTPSAKVPTGKGAASAVAEGPQKTVVKSIGGVGLTVDGERVQIKPKAPVKAPPGKVAASAGAAAPQKTVVKSIGGVGLTADGERVQIKPKAPVKAPPGKVAASAGAAAQSKPQMEPIGEAFPSDKGRSIQQEAPAGSQGERVRIRVGGESEKYPDKTIYIHDSPYEQVGKIPASQSSDEAAPSGTRAMPLYEKPATQERKSLPGHMKTPRPVETVASEPNRTTAAEIRPTAGGTGADLIANYLPLALEVFGDMGIRSRIEEEFAASEPIITENRIKFPEEGVLVVVYLQETAFPDPEGRKAHMFLDLRLQYGGWTKQEALERWNQTPQLFGLPDNWRPKPIIFNWIPPLQQVLGCDDKIKDYIQKRIDELDYAMNSTCGDERYFESIRKERMRLVGMLDDAEQRSFQR